MFDKTLRWNIAAHTHHSFKLLFTQVTPFVCIRAQCIWCQKVFGPLEFEGQTMWIFVALVYSQNIEMEIMKLFS